MSRTRARFSDNRVVVGRAVRVRLIDNLLEPSLPLPHLFNLLRVVVWRYLRLEVGQEVLAKATDVIIDELATADLVVPDVGDRSQEPPVLGFVLEIELIPERVVLRLQRHAEFVLTTTE